MQKLLTWMSTLLLTLTILLLPSACTLPWMQEDDPLDITPKLKATWNIHEKIEHHGDGSVTYQSVRWGGIVALVKEHNLPVDWSGYESITYEFAEPLKVDVQVWVAGVVRYAKKGITKFTCYFDGIDMHQVNEVVLQTVEPTVMTIKSLTLTPVSGSWDSTPIWEGECILGNWENGFTIAPEQFSTAMVGDKLEFVFTTDVSDLSRTYWQLKTIYNATDQILEGNSNEVNDWGCAQLGEKATTYRIRLTAKDVKQLKKRGLFANGYYAIVTQVNLLRKGVINADGSADSQKENEESGVHYNKWE